MSRWCKLSTNLDLKEDFDYNNSYFGHKKTMFEEKSSIRRNLFPDKRPTFYYKTKNALSNHVTKINKAFNIFRNKISVAVQNFHCNSYKKHTLEDCECVPSGFQTPSIKTRVILGRTPIKLYSPFGIDTPIRHQ